MFGRKKDEEKEKEKEKKIGRRGSLVSLIRKYSDTNFFGLPSSPRIESTSSSPHFPVADLDEVKERGDDDDDDDDGGGGDGGDGGGGDGKKKNKKTLPVAPPEGYEIHGDDSILRKYLLRELMKHPHHRVVFVDWSSNNTLHHPIFSNNQHLLWKVISEKEGMAFRWLVMHSDIFSIVDTQLGLTTKGLEEARALTDAVASSPSQSLSSSLPSSVVPSPVLQTHQPTSAPASASSSPVASMSTRTVNKKLRKLAFHDLPIEEEEGDRKSGVGGAAEDKKKPDGFEAASKMSASVRVKNLIQSMEEELEEEEEEEEEDGDGKDGDDENSNKETLGNKNKKALTKEEDTAIPRSTTTERLLSSLNEIEISEDSILAKKSKAKPSSSSSSSSSSSTSSSSSSSSSPVMLREVEKLNEEVNRMEKTLMEESVPVSASQRLRNVMKQLEEEEDQRITASATQQ